MHLKDDFLSVQFSGRFFGEVSIVIQLENNEQGFKETNKKDLVDTVKKYECEKIIITGEEPLLNLENENFIDFIQYLCENNYKVTIETNGEIDIDLKKNYEIFKNVTFSITLNKKLTPRDYWYINEDNYIKTEYNSKEIPTDYLIGLKSRGIDVFVIPPFFNYKDVKFSNKDLLDYCLRYGFNFSIREELLKNDNLLVSNSINNTPKYISEH